MADAIDDVSQRAVRPPLLMLALLLAAWGLDWIWPLPFVPQAWPNTWIGGAVFALGILIVAVAVAQFRRAGTRIETYKPTTAIVETGLYAWSRNPVYLAATLAFMGAAIAFDTLWMVLAAAPFYGVIGTYVVPREEDYLARKFGGAYLDYKTRVRRWL